MVTLGQLERISALINKNQVIVAESVSGQLSAFPEDASVVDKNVVELKKVVTEIDTVWKAYMATHLTPEEKKLAEEFDAHRRTYGRTWAVAGDCRFGRP